MKRKVLSFLTGIAVMSASAVPVLADSTDSLMDSVIGKLVSSFSEIADGVLFVITDILPLALPLIGIALLIFFTIWFFGQEFFWW